jgi:ADP-ribose pyrophosphatase
MRPWKRIDPTIVTKIDYQDMVVKTFKTPDGKTATRAIFLAESKKAAGVIAITKDYKVIVARQFRPGPEKIMDEIPGGYVEENEEPEQAARRELMEETGYTAGEMTFLGEFGRDAYMNGRWHYYLAKDCMKSNKQQLDHDEFVTIELLSIQEFIDGAKNDHMTDMAAVLVAYDQLKELEKGGGR